MKWWMLIAAGTLTIPIWAVVTNTIIGNFIGIIWSYLGWLIVIETREEFSELKKKHKAIINSVYGQQAKKK